MNYGSSKSLCEIHVKVFGFKQVNCLQTNRCVQNQSVGVHERVTKNTYSYNTLTYIDFSRHIRFMCKFSKFIKSQDHGNVSITHLRAMHFTI